MVTPFFFDEDTPLILGSFSSLPKRSLFKLISISCVTKVSFLRSNIPFLKKYLSLSFLLVFVFTKISSPFKTSSLIDRLKLVIW